MKGTTIVLMKSDEIMQTIQWRFQDFSEGGTNPQVMKDVE